MIIAHTTDGRGIDVTTPYADSPFEAATGTWVEWATYVDVTNVTPSALDGDQPEE